MVSDCVNADGEIPAISFILGDMLVDPFMADQKVLSRFSLWQFVPDRDLPRSIGQTDSGKHSPLTKPCRRSSDNDLFLIRSSAKLTIVPTELPRNDPLAASHFFSDCSLIQTCLFQSINLISELFGELLILFHPYSFDLVV